MRWLSLKRWKFNLTALIILAVIITVYWFTMWNEPSNKDYQSFVNTLNDEVAKFQTNNQGNLPVSGFTASLENPEGTYLIIDICRLNIPRNFAAVDGEGNDNCDSGNCECDANASYVWLLDSYGKVFSKCVGDKCSSNGSDGYQGVWP